MSDFFTALNALIRMFADARVDIERSTTERERNKHAVRAARYDQAIRLLLADSPNIIPEGGLGSYAAERG